jgi:hypothetical protein
MLASVVGVAMNMAAINTNNSLIINNDLIKRKNNMGEDNQAGGNEQVFPRVQVPMITKKPVEMSFIDALHTTIDGKKITRIAWETNTIYGYMLDNQLMISINGEIHSWTLVPGDITANDWIVLPE